MLNGLDHFLCNAERFRYASLRHSFPSVGVCADEYKRVKICGLVSSIEAT